MRLTFQREASRGLSATYHFAFTGREPADATVTIQDRTIAIQPGHVGEAQVQITADSDTWLGVLAKNRSLLWATLLGKIRIRGPLRLLAAFRRCFPELSRAAALPKFPVDYRGLL
jgi:SCP-2 sterol transfer family